MNLALTTQIKYLYEQDLNFLKKLETYGISTDKEVNLYIIRTGYGSKQNVEASTRYIKNKTKALGEYFPDIKIHEIIINDLNKLKEIFKTIDNDAKCVGYIIQEPFEVPKEMEDEYKQIRLDFENSLFKKERPINIDIDKTTTYSKLKRLENPDDINLYPITTRSCIKLIQELNLKREHTIAVIGRSEIVSKPLVEYLIYKGYTVININSKTSAQDKKHLLEAADCIVLATGHYGVIDLYNYKFKPNVFIIDVGINKHPSTGTLVGDLDMDISLKISPFRISNVVAYTPVPGGVGKLTSIGFSYAVACNFIKLISEGIINGDK